jgi:hypothetical protein
VRPQPLHIYYNTAGQSEYGLRSGPADADRIVLILPPLFDEMNRTRRMMVEAMRHLAKRDVASLLPDLPGSNESRTALSEQSMESWRRAASDAAIQSKATHVLSIRGGSLLDDATGLPICRLAPVKGASLLKTLLRARISADKEAGLVTSAEQLIIEGQRHGLNLAGHAIGPAMLGDLEKAIPILSDATTEAALSDVAGTTLWLRSEPSDSPEMSAALAGYIDQWSATCGR